MINYHNLNYNGNKVTFSQGVNLMVNATEMAKPFGKRPVDWMNTQQSKDIIATLSKVRNLTFEQLVYVKQGSSVYGGGTWFHEDVALVFAQWLSPEFYIWCNDQVKELLTKGKVELRPSAPVPTAPAHLTPEQEAKIRYADACIESDVPTSLRGIANRIMLTDGKRMTRSQLVAWLFNNGYLQKDESTLYCPTQWAIEMGYFMIKIGRRQIRTDRAPKNGRDKGVPTPKGAMHIINVLAHCLPAMKEQSQGAAGVNF